MNQLLFLYNCTRMFRVGLISKRVRQYADRNFVDKYILERIDLYKFYFKGTGDEGGLNPSSNVIIAAR